MSFSEPDQPGSATPEPLPPPPAVGPPGPGSPPPGPGVPGGAGEPEGGRRVWRSGIEWVVVIALALVAAFLVKTFILQTFFIPSASMEPTLDIGDRVFVNKLSYHLHGVHRGDIVVFTLPKGESAGVGIDDLIKRVVGLPGDTIEAVGGKVYIDGKPLKEDYLPSGVSPVAGLPLPKQVIPKGEYFLMGDNRGDSKDSRAFGPIARHLIVGRAFVRVWPLSRFGFL